MSRIWLTLTLTIFTVSTSWAAFSEVARKDHAEAFASVAAPEQEKYNFKLGTATTDLVGTAQVEYDDNISNINTNKIDDIIIRLGLESKTLWPITELNSLTLDLDLGYRVYLDNSDLSSNNNFLDVNPGSELALKWWIKNFSFKLYDNFNFTVDSGDVRVFVPSAGITNNLVEYAHIENRAGLDMMWDLNDLKVYFGYARDDVRADKAAFNTLDRTEHSIYATPMVLVNPSLSIGWVARFYWNEYDNGFQNDSDGFLTGPTASYQLTTNTSVEADLFWHKANYDNSGTSADTSDINTWQSNFRLDQDLNERLSHSFQVQKASEYSSITNFQDSYTLTYRPTYRIKENLSIAGRFSYSDTEDSSLVNGEDSILRAYGFVLYYDLSNKMALDTSYDYIVKTSNIASRNYNKNRVAVKLTYDF